MTKRAQNLIAQTYGDKISPAIAALVEFAAKNPGLEYGNYGGDYKAYRAEQRDINQDWQRFKSALSIAAIEGVTDADVIAEAPHAFSGRLEWVTMVDGVSAAYWEYTPGQYTRTEYRKAAATLIEYATRRVRQARPPQKRQPITIAELKALNALNGYCWFEPSTMRFFGTKIESGIIRGHYFITSEQPPHGARKFSVRSFDEKGSVDTVGEFCSFSNKAEAVAAIPTEEPAIASA